MAMKKEDLKAKTADELQKALLDARKEQMNLRFQRSGGQLERTSEIRKNRRGIARIKTFMKQNAGGAAAPAKPKAVKAAAPKKEAAPKAKAKKA
jgi:large subunit ribosomal protein L29